MLKAITTIVASGVATASLLVLPSNAGATGYPHPNPQALVPICHREGNGTFHVITISENAVPAHLRHGDIYPVPSSGCQNTATTSTSTTSTTTTSSTTSTSTIPPTSTTTEAPSTTTTTVLSESTTSTTIASSESIVRTQQEADAEAVAVDENGDRVVVFAG